MLVKACTQLAPHHAINSACVSFLTSCSQSMKNLGEQWGKQKKQRAGSHFTNVLDFFRFAQTLWKLCRIEFSVLSILVFCSVMFCRKMRCNHLSKHNSPYNQQCRSKLLDLPLPKDEILGEQLAKQKSRINVVTFLVMQRCYTKLYDAL